MSEYKQKEMNEERVVNIDEVKRLIKNEADLNRVLSYLGDVGEDYRIVMRYDKTKDEFIFNKEQWYYEM